MSGQTTKKERLDNSGEFGHPSPGVYRTPQTDPCVGMNSGSTWGGVVRLQSGASKPRDKPASKDVLPPPGQLPGMDWRDQCNRGGLFERPRKTDLSTGEVLEE